MKKQNTDEVSTKATSLHCTNDQSTRGDQTPISTQSLSLCEDSRNYTIWDTRHQRKHQLQCHRATNSYNSKMCKKVESQGTNYDTRYTQLSIKLNIKQRMCNMIIVNK
jgi:hypothetical protein